jgi:hypothetical protein
MFVFLRLTSELTGTYANIAMDSVGAIVASRTDPVAVEHADHRTGGIRRTANAVVTVASRTGETLACLYYGTIVEAQAAEQNAVAQMSVKAMECFGRMPPWGVHSRLIAEILERVVAEGRKS